MSNESWSASNLYHFALFSIYQYYVAASHSLRPHAGVVSFETPLEPERAQLGAS